SANRARIVVANHESPDRWWAGGIVDDGDRGALIVRKSVGIDVAGKVGDIMRRERERSTRFGVPEEDRVVAKSRGGIEFREKAIRGRQRTGHRLAERKCRRVEGLAQRTRMAG